ncbi:MAG: hypothetical protein ACREL7_11990 [Longimicrobiales bacterium]
MFVRARIGEPFHGRWVPCLMFTRCIFCHGEFGSNQSLEHFPLARRIAFDPSRGRLWAVCEGCRRWSLAPIEERWEALEEIEKLATDRGRLLSQTENIALIRAEDIDIVRVGRARLAEEAWWRYGKELKARRSRYRTASYIEGAAILGLTFVTSGGWFLLGTDTLASFLRWRQFGTVAWRGSASCERCATPARELSFKQSKRLLVVPDEAESFALELRCERCRSRRESGIIRIDGLTAQHVLRRTLAWRHHQGASDERVTDATRLIDDVGSAEALTREIARRGLALERLDGKKNRTEAIALEIALNDNAERRLLEMELSELESRWREEEEIASIIDGELTRVPSLEKLRHVLTGRPWPGSSQGS